MDGRRSRSSSRERDSSRRRHRKHRKRHRLSRSRSRSYERNGYGAAAIHINPAFGIPSSTSVPGQMGYSASQLLQNNNMLEAEIIRLKTELTNEQGRMQIELQRYQMLQQELRNVQIQRDQANKRCNEVMAERRMMVDMKTELANRLNSIEVSNQMLREELAKSNQETEAKAEEIRAITYQSEIVRQQINALNERNAALKAKCETLVVQNRQQFDELDARHKYIESSKLNVKKSEADLQLANAEIKRLLREVDNTQKAKSTSHNDRQMFEEVLKRKDDELRLSNYKSSTEIKARDDKIAKLENRLKHEKPAVHHDLTIETIYIAIETMKNTYEKQLSRLEEEIEELRTERADKTNHIADDDVAVRPSLQQNLEELPEYLQTPRKPDPAKMDRVRKTVQVKIKLDYNSDFPLNDEPERSTRASSGPPVDSPMAWIQRKPFEALPSISAPLFGKTGRKEGKEEKPSISNTSPSTTVHFMKEDDIADSADSMMASESACVLSAPSQKEVKLDIAHSFTEEDLLLAEPTELISPIQDFKLIEQQLLDGE